MILNNENYYSPEANQEYMSVSQYKAFMNCEAAAMASISGKYERPTTRALLVGSFVDRYFEGTSNFQRRICFYAEQVYRRILHWRIFSL